MLKNKRIIPRRAVYPGKDFMKKEYKPLIPNFLAVGHVYHDDGGMVLDSVTTILKAELDLYNFSTQDAANRGTNVHKSCQYYDEQDLNESSLTEEVNAYFQQYKFAKKAHNITVHHNELMRYSKKYGYAGTVDKIVTIAGENGILDIKTSKTAAACSWWELQTAAYFDFLKEECAAMSLPITRRWVLVLAPDKFKLIEHTGKRDFNEFLALLSANAIKINRGYRKRKVEQVN